MQGIYGQGSKSPECSVDLPPLLEHNVPPDGGGRSVRVPISMICVITAIALPSSTAFACPPPPPPGSSYALAREEEKAERRRTADIVAEGRWHYTQMALRADKRMDARRAAEPPGGTKIKNFFISYAMLLPTKITRGKHKTSYKVWYSRLNLTCPSDGPPEGTHGTYYLKRTKINNRDVLWLAALDKAAPPQQHNTESPQ